MKRQILAIALVILGICALGVISAAAQDVLKIDYFANNAVAGAPDATVRVSNPGTASAANLCAMVYVFDNDQEPTECCGCLVTPDGLRTFSVKTDLNKNPLTGVVSTTGAIKIVSAAVNNSPCDPTSNVTPTPTVRAWATHIQNKVGSAYPITETAFSDATLSTAELTNLVEDCYFTQKMASGHGICTCGTGD
jgi:hypothetical protein